MLTVAAGKPLRDFLTLAGNLWKERVQNQTVLRKYFKELPFLKVHRHEYSASDGYWIDQSPLYAG